MASNVQKLPLSRTLPTHVKKKINAAQQQLGKNLPCHVVKVNSNGSVTVAFDVADPVLTLPQVTLAVAQSAYVRLPVQVNDKGVARASDVYMGGVTGLGGGTATFAQRGNLSTMVFDPVADATWTPPADPNKLDLTGKNGVLLHNPNGDVSISVNLHDIVISVPAGHAVRINGTLDVEGGPIINNGTIVVVP